MDYERKARMLRALHQKRVNNLKNKLDDHQNQVRYIIETSQPTQDSLKQLYGGIGVGQKFISLYKRKYPHHWEEKALDAMLTKLEYTVKIATNKFHELQDLGDKIQTNMASMFKQHFKELTPDPEAEDDTDSIYITPYENLASIGHVKISGKK